MILIIPDVHGRTFWKEKVYDVIKNDKNTHIVFLGDYVDPYGYEGVTNEDAICILEEIIDLKKQYSNQITLLLGNHDCGYIYPDVCSSRRDNLHYKDISHLFKDNIELFDLAYYANINDKKYLFTHAGIHKKWLDLLFNNDNINNELIADLLNNWFHVSTNDHELYLGMYSHFRGWLGGPFGSCVWADVREWGQSVGNIDENIKLNLFQIFGHTQLEEDPIINQHIACLDVRRYFILNDENQLIDQNQKTYNLIEEQ